MGQRGPKTLPANVHRLRGNPSKLNLNDLADGTVQPDVEIPGCPKHLLPEAKKFWKRLAPELEKLGLVAAIDQAALAMVCQEWAWLVWHEQLLQRDVHLAEQKRAAFEAERAAVLERGGFWSKGDFKGGDGFQIPTPNGSLMYSPHWVARNKHTQQLDRLLANFGMNPSARGRVTPSSRQMPLPLPDDETPPGGFAAL